MLKIICIKDLLTEHPITQITYKHINQYSTDSLNNYKINILHNVKKTYYNCSNDVVINKHNTINTNYTYNVTKISKLMEFNDSKYFTKKIEHKHNMINNVTRHNHNNYAHNVIEKKVRKHIKHINNYNTEINYYSKRSLSKKNYYNFYNDSLISEKLRT